MFEEVYFVYLATGILAFLAGLSYFKSTAVFLTRCFLLRAFGCVGFFGLQQ